MFEKGRTAVWLIALAALAGCVREQNVASRSAAALSQPPHAQAHQHAAPSSAGTVQAGQPAETLSPDPLDAPAATSVQEAQHSAELSEGMAGGGHGDHGGHGGHAGHGARTYRHVDAGRGPEAHEGSEPQTPAAEPHHHHHDAAPAAPAAETAATVYVCPMHPEVTSSEPGTCSKCGMALVERRKE